MSDTQKPADTRVRLDKWLWAARFFKTRSLAVEDIERGRVSVGGAVAKASREVHVGDLISLRQAGQSVSLEREVRVLGLSNQRGAAPVAQALYEETPASLARRELWLAQRKQGVEPALSLDQGRPTKRDRRQLADKRHDWQRWSASIDDA